MLASLSPVHSKSPSYSAFTSAGLDDLSAGTIQALIPEGSEPMVAILFPVGHCWDCSF